MNCTALIIRFGIHKEEQVLCDEISYFVIIQLFYGDIRIKQDNVMLVSLLQTV